VRPGDIPEQIRWALEQLPAAQETKLYNSGNFFDRQAIPRSDHKAIADLVRRFETVIVENHPKLCDDECLRFQDSIAPAQLEVALGLETCHRRVLASLNKQMTLDDFSRAVRFLHSGGIRTRAFVLLKPPFLNESEAVEWALRSIDFAFDLRMDCVSVVPTRGGNGIMETLRDSGRFSPPTGASLERVLEQGLSRRSGRVFMDLWDAELFFPCAACRVPRVERLRAMNLSQQVLDTVSCEACGG
jgi:radical SAM enzyme (TIGR01210 family)